MLFPELVEIISSDIFAHQNKLNHTHKKEYLWLLAMMATGKAADTPIVIMLRKIDEFLSQPGAKSLPKSGPVAGLLREPIVAYCVVKWLDVALMEDHFFDSGIHDEDHMPLHFLLLTEVCLAIIPSGLFHWLTFRL